MLDDEEDFVSSSRGGGGPGAWRQRLKEVVIDKQYLNEVIMDYLVTEGYQDAAGELAAESGTRPPVPLDSIDKRVRVRDAVMRGDIAGAIADTNRLDPTLLPSNPELSFRLHCQRVIDLVGSGQWAEALEVATSELPPCVESTPSLQGQLEDLMLLFGLPDPHADPGCSEMLSDKHRLETADKLNTAILVAEGQEPESRLPLLLKLLKRSQERLGGRSEVPSIPDPLLGTGGIPRSVDIRDVAACYSSSPEARNGSSGGGGRRPGQGPVDGLTYNARLFLDSLDPL